MILSNRNTVVVSDRLALREQRLSAARGKLHGSQILSFEQLALRLAGGFACEIGDDCLREAIQLGLIAELGELDSIKLLPGMVSAAAATLRKIWESGITLNPQSHSHPRLESLMRLEASVVANLSPPMSRPADIVAAAFARITHAPVVLGPITIIGVSDLLPCWRPLLIALAGQVQVRWLAGARPVPTWIENGVIEIVRAAPTSPNIKIFSTASALHEATEGMRWARELLASGRAQAHEIALASTTTARFDAHLLTLRDEAGLDLHFGHGVSVISTPEGQTAAALAEIVLQGLSQVRLRRLIRLCGNDGPISCLKTLPRDLPLSTPAEWNRFLSNLPASSGTGGELWTGQLIALLTLLSQGRSAASAIGEGVLKGRALGVWRKALLTGPAASLEATLATLRQDDGLDSCTSLTWMPASMLAASPRRFVRLLGLNASQWPRASSEDRLLPDHVMPRRQLDPLPLEMVDRRDFLSILATTSGAVVLSYARRNDEGRLLGRSTLLADISGLAEESYLRRNAVPLHAFSEGDRLAARPEESTHLPQIASAATCWNDWHLNGVNAHDGLVRADHPALMSIAGRTHSASSLTLLLRNPLAYVWKYGMGWREPKDLAPSLTMDSNDFGTLVHEVLDAALWTLEAETTGGLAQADPGRIQQVVDETVATVGAAWEESFSLPPRVLWDKALREAAELAHAGLTYVDTVHAGQRSYGEVAFGGSAARNSTVAPWDATAPVEIAETGLKIAGYIDRLDLAADGLSAVVRDYKTGKFPKDDELLINGGKELQRCLYAFAATSLLGDGVAVRSTLLYPREQRELELTEPAAVLTNVAAFLRSGHENLLAGRGLPGPDAADTYDELAFALPANAAAVYCKRKSIAVSAAMGPATDVWEAP